MERQYGADVVDVEKLDLMMGRGLVAEFCRLAGPYDFTGGFHFLPSFHIPYPNVLQMCSQALAATRTGYVLGFLSAKGSLARACGRQTEETRP